MLMDFPDVANTMKQETFIQSSGDTIGNVHYAKF
jgi:hypothetical protein